MVTEGGVRGGHMGDRKREGWGSREGGEEETVVRNHVEIHRQLHRSWGCL